MAILVPTLSCSKLVEESYSKMRLIQLTRRKCVLIATLMPLVSSVQENAYADDDSTKTKSDDSLLSKILSIFDPNEETKSGKKLPKTYLKMARDVVKNLSEALTLDPIADVQKFRESATTAKDAIRDYLTNWKGSKSVDNEPSYQALESALRILGTFYAKSGPTATMPENLRTEIIELLSKADEEL